MNINFNKMFRGVSNPEDFLELLGFFILIVLLALTQVF